MDSPWVHLQSPVTGLWFVESKLLTEFLSVPRGGTGRCQEAIKCCLRNLHSGPGCSYWHQAPQELPRWVTRGPEAGEGRSWVWGPRGTGGRGPPIRWWRGQLLQGWTSRRPSGAGFGQGVVLFGSLCFTSLYPVTFDASSFPGFKTAPPKPMLRREVQYQQTSACWSHSLPSRTHRGTWPHFMRVSASPWPLLIRQRNPFHLRFLLWTWAYTKYLRFNKY